MPIINWLHNELDFPYLVGMELANISKSQKASVAVTGMHIFSYISVGALFEYQFLHKINNTCAGNFVFAS